MLMLCIVIKRPSDPPVNHLPIPVDHLPSDPPVNHLPTSFNNETDLRCFAHLVASNYACNNTGGSYLHYYSTDITSRCFIIK